MKAVIINAYGDNSVVNVGEAAVPRPQAGEVLVKVKTAGLNPIDWKIRDGVGQRLGMTLPITLGSEVAGIVEEVGEGVSGFKKGDAVYGMAKAAFAEYVAVSAQNLALKPASLDFTQAAAIPLAGLTAWQAMFDVAKLASGQRLLITGSSGGVGSLAVQLAKAKGAHVTAVASGRNEDFVRGLGADVFIDYTKVPYETVAKDMDVVFDTIGGDTFDRAFRTLKKGGFMSTVVAFPKDEAQQYGVSVERVFCKPNGEELAQMSQLVEAGKLKAHVEAVLPLADIKQAFDLSATGRTRGKIVIQVAA